MSPQRYYSRFCPSTINFYRQTSEWRKVRESPSQTTRRKLQKGRFLEFYFSFFPACFLRFISEGLGSFISFFVDFWDRLFCIITRWVWSGGNLGLGWAGCGEKQRCFREFSLLLLLPISSLALDKNVSCEYLNYKIKIVGMGRWFIC